MDNNWKQDPRLKAMDPEKVTLLTGFAEKIIYRLIPPAIFPAASFRN